MRQCLSSDHLVCVHLVCMCVHACARAHVGVYVCVRACVFMCVCVCACVCVHVRAPVHACVVYVHSRTLTRALIK